MNDPLDALRTPVEPVDPDPSFAEQLRERLRDAVVKTGGATMTDAETRTTATAKRTDHPDLCPYIVVSDARRALTWYGTVFGAIRRSEPIVNADGTIGHAEVAIGDSVLMLAEQSDLWPDVPVGAPTGSTHSHTLHLQVADVDETTRRAAEHGAHVERPPRDQPYGRGSVVVDPFGHRWMLLVPPTGSEG
ncbi:VOC family protein [Nocardia sp. NPDC052254]|uniref:VOC family protein n=1 Tax=Nocardia sp. NPDC052254 TaxID=3155681 RepID=UPI00341BD90D